LAYDSDLVAFPKFPEIVTLVFEDQWFGFRIVVLEWWDYVQLFEKVQDFGFLVVFHAVGSKVDYCLRQSMREKITASTFIFSVRDVPD